MRELLNAPVSVGLTERQHDALEEYAGALGLTTSALARDLIVAAVPVSFYRHADPNPDQLTIEETAAV